MVDKVVVVDEREGRVIVPIRDGAGKLEYEKLKEVLMYHPDSFSHEDLKELLEEMLDDVIYGPSLLA